MTIFNCQNCGIEVKRWGKPSNRIRAMKFCSKQCYWNSMTVLMECKTCGKKFKRTSNGIQKYCSKKCLMNGDFVRLQRESHLGNVAWNKGKPNTWSNGERSNFWKGGITPINKAIRSSLEYEEWRNKVFERDLYTCVNCGKIGGWLEADHIKPFSLYPDLRLDVNNGRTLCKPCHKKIGWELFRNKNPRKVLG